MRYEDILDYDEFRDCDRDIKSLFNSYTEDSDEEFPLKNNGKKLLRRKNDIKAAKKKLQRLSHYTGISTQEIENRYEKRYLKSLIKTMCQKSHPDYNFWNGCPCCRIKKKGNAKYNHHDGQIYSRADWELENDEIPEEDGIFFHGYNTNREITIEKTRKFLSEVSYEYLVKLDNSPYYLVCKKPQNLTYFEFCGLVEAELNFRYEESFVF